MYVESFSIALLLAQSGDNNKDEASILLLLVLDDLASEDDSVADPLPEHGAALLGHGHTHCSLGGTSWR